MSGMATDFKRVGELNTPECHIKMVCAVWRMSPSTQVFIGGATMDDLDRAWYEITGMSLVRSGAQYVDVFDSKLREKGAVKTELERALGSANETESKPGVREVLHGLQLCTCRDGARYRFLRQGEDMLDTEQEERFAQMWRDISRKGIWREKMDTRIDQAMQEQEANSHHRGEVMNPPASAAPGAEAGNLESLVEQFNDGHTPPDHD